MYHSPVLLVASVSGLNIRPASVYVDATFGGGGHSKEILDNMDSQSKLFAFDQDEDAQRNAIDDCRFTLIPQNFGYLKRFMKFYKIDKVDGILADLGVSSHQFDTPDRGFSIRFDGPLDMRMNQQQALTAKEIVNTYSETALADLLFAYGELRKRKKNSQSNCATQTRRNRNHLAIQRVVASGITQRKRAQGTGQDLPVSSDGSQ
ncbi:MAG: 16S rRNA (cytosine(1402)-N(4))-methyltransferase RsmH [Flavobacteriaceae bacterium]